MVNSKAKSLKAKVNSLKSRRFLKRGSLLMSIFLLAAYTIGISQLLACPHYDENGEEYYWYFDEDASSTMLYMKDEYDRFVYLDTDYNVLSEEYKIYLYYDNESFSFGNKNSLKVGNTDYWLDTPIKYISLENASAITSNLYLLAYSIDTTEFTKARHKDILNTLNETIKKNEMRPIESKVLNIEPKIVKEYSDTTPTSETKIRKLSVPLQITIQLGDLSLQKSDIEKLTGIYFENTGTNQYRPVKIKGTYDAASHTYTFSSNKAGIHTISLTENNSASLKQARSNNNIEEPGRIEEDEGPADSSEEVEDPNIKEEAELGADEEIVESKESEKEDFAQVMHTLSNSQEIQNDEEKVEPEEQRGTSILTIILGGMASVAMVGFAIYQVKVNKK